MSHQHRTSKRQQDAARTADPSPAPQRPAASRSASHPLLRVQRLAGNRATSLLLQARANAADAQPAPAPVALVNRCGLPDVLRAGVESLSGLDLSQVRVYRDSARPAQLNALAFAQGDEIHLGPGQERHLPHEAWHVVQQRQGRVKATPQRAGAAINDETSLETEADRMGARAERGGCLPAQTTSISPSAAPAQSPMQLKPADIVGSFNLGYDNNGALTNVAADRGPVGRAALINWQIREGWVTPNKTLIGGHLFKREFGGLDNATNVVPWTPEAEQRFTVFEDQYTLAVRAAAPIIATVSTVARFVDRPEFVVTSAELDAAGWAAAAPDKALRIAQFDKVADLLSEIPNEVEVKVTAPGGLMEKFEASRADMEPPFVKNPAALLPAFTPAKPVFTMNPNVPRLLKKVVNWSNQKDKSLKFLQHEWAHAPDFGVPGKWNPQQGRLFEQAIETHIMAPATTQILGTFRGTTEVLHYVDPNTLLWACTAPGDGQLVGGWELGQLQFDMLMTTGTVK